MTNQASEDKRRFHRILYNANAILNVAGEPLDCTIIDLSLNGCLLRLEQPWADQADHVCQLILPLSEQERIVMNLLISHVDEDKVGLCCTTIDIDSISNLRRLVELNLGDSSLLERELAALGNLAL